MDDWSDFLGVIMLGALALGALVIMGILSYEGQNIPASIGTAFGTVVGALAGLLHPRNGGK
jgi:hypothetical protein